MRSSILKIVFKLILLSNFKFSSSSLLSIGSPCILKSGANGTCQELNDCSIIKDLWEKGAITRAHLTKCNELQQTICCPFALDDRTATHRTTTSKFDEGISTEGKTRPSTQTTIENQERISQKKCKEYGKKVFQITKIPPMFGGKEAREVRTSKCTQNKISFIETAVNELPHQALLGYSPRNTEIKWLCGGSLVSPKFVLTVAHCLSSRQFGHVQKVKVGMKYKDQEHDNEKVFVYNIKETFKHPNYNERTFNEDIALLKLDGTVSINENILPICLPTKQHNDFKAMAIIRSHTYGKQSEILMKATLERFTHTECKNFYPDDGNMLIDEKTMLCYGHRIENMDTCRVRI
ncbi:unnamed protein product [Chironomus riparius]|uniref:Peptidase S1 domain-containing protein n=1 Tax=Chironomus riparius TaxID=315576 RepID=A0A9N9RKL2_9DIPT|nr:unnamed protein product [Chironomus riparius]